MVSTLGDGPLTARVMAKRLSVTRRRAEQMVKRLEGEVVVRVGAEPTGRRHAALWALKGP